jgi:type IV pilus assembly protein PilV
MRIPRPVTADRPRRHAGRGFTLLEVLVSIVILSFGVLGMVGMQALALQSNKEARYQSTAVQFAKELADMMRGNKDVALAAGTANPYLVASTSADNGGSPVANCFATYCATPLAVATWEAREWLLRVKATLPGARVTVCQDTAPYDAAGLPQWNCTPGTGSITPTVIKIGWTRLGTDRGTLSGTGGTKDSQGLEQAIRPSVMVPLTPGSADVGTMP